MQAIFAGTLFVSAALLFCVQPMIAKMILPLLGGSPAVWNTCMVFFQAALLAGYLYAHAAGSWLPLRWQPAVHLGLLVVPLLVLPIALPADVAASVPTNPEPVFWVLWLLLVTVGLPFFVVATTAPLVQKWFSHSGHAQAGDPYFLYVASNLGSMLTLLAYPLVLEPWLPLAGQSAWWRNVYIALIVLMAACAVLVWRFGQPDELCGKANPSPPAPLPQGERGEIDPSPPTALWEKGEDGELTIGRRARWVLLAFVPSSLMLGVTTFITTDIATIPFLWVMPLALYLVSFILVFARRRLLSPALMARLLPIPTLVVAITLVAGATLPVWALIGLHWLVLFLAAMVCHGALADDRPTPRHLTEFYLWLSVGGVLGGIANALVAPLIFRGGIYEYPLVLVLACLLRPGRDLAKANREGEAPAEPRSAGDSRLGGSLALPSAPRIARWLDFLLPAGLAAIALATMWIIGAIDPEFRDVESGFRARLIFLGVLAFVCYTFVDRPVRFAVGIGGLMLVLSLVLQPHGRDLLVARNFFGVIHVQDDPAGRFRQLIHGNTVHGVQRLLPDGSPDPKCEPLTYYHRTGPIGQVFEVINARPARQDIALAGLGIGALAYYAKPEQRWTYYEIDPAIEPVARNPRFFTFLANCKAAELQVITGDARLKIQEAPPGSVDLIVIDAFSSDSVPVHLLSQEALDLYRTKLTADGILAFHISNRYLDLAPVLANLAAAREPPMVCYGRDDLQLDPAEKEAGKKESRWVVLARSEADLGKLPSDPRWQRLAARPGARVWSDDFSNLWEVLRK